MSHEPTATITRRGLLGAVAAGVARGAAAQAPLAGFAATLAGATALPPQIRLARASPALVVAADGAVRVAGPDAPRFTHDPLTRAALGLLIEGAARNAAAVAADPQAALWRRTGLVELRAEPGGAPDGGPALRIAAAQARPGTKALVDVGAIAADSFATASLWLRALPGQRGVWRLGVADAGSQRARRLVATLDERWQHVALPMLWEFRDTGPKHIEVADLSSPLPDGHLREALIWGIQHEPGNAASSLVPPGLDARAADVATVTFGAAFAEAGTLRLLLPAGGRRGGVLVDAVGGAAPALRIDYTASGFIGARVGRLALRGFGDASADTHVELAWSRAGATLRSGRGFDALTARAGVLGDPGRVAAEALRLLAAGDGDRPLDRPLGGIELWAAAVAPAAVAAPRLAPAGYRLAFGDEFDDANVARINENATGGRPGAPAWRSRYRHPRADIINSEKQTYMDVAYAGTGPRPLGIQPFGIRDSVLTIRAERASPAIRPFIGNQAYTSGCITSELTHWQTYGWFEMAARLPPGKGFWPAFWLLPKAQRWPPEIDIFECSGVRRMGVRWGVLWPAPGTRDGRDGQGEWVEGLIDTTDGFHVYALEWTRDSLAWFVDGTAIHRRANPGIHEDMYVLANLALGSGDPFWIPDPDAGTPFPGLLQIDWIRVYARG